MTEQAMAARPSSPNLRRQGDRGSHGGDGDKEAVGEGCRSAVDPCVMPSEHTTLQPSDIRNIACTKNLCTELLRTERRKYL